MQTLLCWRHAVELQDGFSLDISAICHPYICQGLQDRHWESRLQLQNGHTSKWADRNQDIPDIRIDFSVSPAFLKVLIDTFVTDRRQQGHIGDSNLFLLEAFFPVRLCIALQNWAEASPDFHMPYLRNLARSCSLLGRRSHFLPCLLRRRLRR